MRGITQLRYLVRYGQLKDSDSRIADRAHTSARIVAQVVDHDPSICPCISHLNPATVARVEYEVRKNRVSGQ